MLVQDQCLPLRAICHGALALTSLELISLANKGIAGPASTFLPTGLSITPTAATGATYEALNPNLLDLPGIIASGALSAVKSPDGNTLLVLVSGYNSWSAKTPETNEYIFVFDISAGKPAQKQVIKIPNSFVGIAFDPTGQNFYVGGGVDDNIHQYSRTGSTWAEKGTAIPLNHNGISNALFPTDVGALTAGIDITQDGNTLVVANHENDSISFIDLTSRAVVKEFDLRPGKIDPAQSGVPGGEYPYGVTVKGNNTVYVSSQRDREVVAVDFTTVTAPKVVGRMPP
jgi:DNA-binding beta-propeller fold protein YncE